MLVAGICLAIALLALLLEAGHSPALSDRHEIRRLRRVADGMHREGAQPFD